MDNNNDNNNTITRLILHGIKLAKELEAKLVPGSASHGQPPADTVSASCEEIIRVFTCVTEKLLPSSSSSLQPHSLTMIHEPPQWSAGGDSGGSVHDWLMGRGIIGSQALDLFHAPQVVLGGEVAAAAEGTAAVNGGAGGASSSQTQRRRREETDRITVNVLAPQMGNLDVPPEDGYTWRKYGQKDILGSKFPRAYYRCTHQKLYNCPAKKLVQRLDDNPQMLKVTYRYHHTCHMSATAPSAPPPPPPPPPAGGGASSSSCWLSMDIKPITSDFGSTSGGAGSSTAAGRYGGREVDYGGGQPVVDMADAMFNSCSSSNNSMDFIFHTTMDEK